MRGLRKREGRKFEKFFSLVQQEAEKQNAVFFLENGEGNEFETDDIEGEDLCGWLIPKQSAEKFEEVWYNDENLEEWSEFICFAFWKGDKENPKIIFESY